VDCARLATLVSAARGACPALESRKRSRSRGVGERPLGQAGGERALQAQHQLDAREAVQAQLLFQRAVERDVVLEMRARLARHGLHHRQHLGRVDRAAGLVHCRASVHSETMPTGEAPRPFLERLDTCCARAKPKRACCCPAASG
jgi:hypothetical protein